MILFDGILSVQNYLDQLTGRCYIIDTDDDRKFIEEIAKENLGRPVKSWSIFETQEALNSGLNLVLVDCCYFDEEIRMRSELRWYELEKIVEE